MSFYLFLFTIPYNHSFRYTELKSADNKEDAHMKESTHLSSTVNYILYEPVLSVFSHKQ